MPAPWEMNWGNPEDENLPPWQRQWGAPAVKPASKQRTIGEAVTDVAAGVVSGAGALTQLPGQLYGLTTGDFSDTGLLKTGREMREYGESLKSAGLKAREEERRQKITEAEKEGQLSAFKTAFSETIKDPGLLTNFLAEQAPQLLVPFGAGRLGKVVGGLRTGVGAAVSAAGVQQGADIGAGTYEAVYKELVSKGVPPEEAAGHALGLARASGAKATVISLLAQRLPGARKLEEALVGGVGGKSRLMNFLTGLAGESTAEVVEETGGRYVQNVAMQEVKPEYSLLTGLGETAGMSAIGGAGLGGISGLLQTPTTPPPKPKPEEKTAESPLLLEGKGVFVPVALPDGSVAMTREDLARYEEEKFRKQYEAQPADTKAPKMLGYEPFIPKITPSGTVAMTPEDVARAEEEEFRKKYAPVMATPEEIEQRKLRERAEAPPEGEFVSGKPLKLTDETKQEIKNLTMEANRLNQEMKSNQAGKLSGKSMRPLLVNALDPKEVTDISPEKSFGWMKSTKRLGSFVSDLVADGTLDPWLPPNMRSGSETFDEQESTEYIKDKIRNKDWKEFDSQNRVRELGAQIESIQNRIKELQAPKKAEEELASMTAEDRMAMRQAAQEAGYVSGVEQAPVAEEVVEEAPLEDEYYPDKDEAEAKQVFEEREQKKEEAGLGQAMKWNQLSDAMKADWRAYTRQPAEQRIVSDNRFEQAIEQAKQNLPVPVAPTPLATTAAPAAAPSAAMAATAAAPEQAAGIPQTVAQAAQPGAPTQLGQPAYPVSAQETDIIEGQAREVPQPAAPEAIAGRKPGTAVSAMETDIIEGQVRFIDDETIAPAVAQLSAPEQQKLAEHYGEPVNSPAFLEKLRKDISDFAVKGSQAISAAIRSIIRKLHAAVLATAVILNPNYMGPGYTVAIPQNVTTVEQVLAQVPASVLERMSPAAQQAYANILPAIQADLKKNNKLFVMTDKPNARVFVFDSNGQPILDKKVLLGVQVGDYYKGDVDKVKANRITPAGLFTMGLRDAKRGVTEYGGDEYATAHDYDFQKVFVLDKALQGRASVTLFHSVYTKMSDAQARLRALAKDSAEDSRYSFGCINVDKTTYKFLLDNYEKQMDGAKLFIVPDNQDTVMDFVRGKAVESQDITRQAAPEVKRTVTKTVPGTPSAATQGEQMVARKEEEAETRRGLYQQAKPGEKGSTKAAVDQVVNDIKSTWKNAPEIEVVQSITDLPAELQKQIAEDKVNPRGIYDPDTKKVYLVADNISSQAQAAITLAHEALGHFGLRAVLGTNFTSMMNSIYDGNKAVRDRADAYMKDGMDKVTAVEEVLSEMAQEVYDTRVPENKTKLSALQKVMNAIRQFLARIGVPMKSISDAQVLALIANARRSVVRGGEYVGMEGGKPLYSAKERIERAAQRMTSKRPEMQRDAFEGVDEKLVDRLGDIFFPQNKTIVDRIEGMKDNFWKKLAQGVADQYRSIKDYTEQGYMLARMSKSIDGALEGLLFNGHVMLNDGALDIKQGTKGLIEVMNPVGKEVDRFQIWMALNRDAQLVRQGKAPSVSPDIVARVSELSKGKIGNKSRLEVYESVRKDLNQLNKSVLDIAYKQGLIDKQAYDTFANDINYIPFYRAMEDGDLQGAATASGLARQEFSKQLKGGEKPFGDLMENTLRNWSHILSASMKNKAANVTMDAALEQGAAYPNLKVGFEWRDGKVYSTKSGELVGDGELKAEYTTQKAGMVKTMMDGKPAYFEVIDPLLLDSISSIGYMGPKSKFLDVAKDFKNLLQFGVTLSPAFKVRNLFRDSISAMAVSDMKLNPFANVAKGWAASANDNPAHISALAGGAIFNFGSYYEGDQSRLIKRLLQQGVNPDSILDNEQKIKSGLQYAWRKYQEWGNKSEAANRMALYQQMRDRGMSHLEASFYARDMLDFSMQGSWPAFRLVTQVVPFLNARVQGLYKLGRDGVVPTSRVIYNTATGKQIELTDKQKAMQFGTVTGAVVLASMLLYLINKDDDEFQKREAWDRDNFWWFRLPGMETALRVPKPFEIGAFGTMSERVLEQIVDQGAEGAQFGESLRRMLGDTFSLNPTPQVFKPLLDLYANKDSFTGAPIETAGMERLSKQERATDTTSPLAKALGGVSNIMANIFGEKTELSPAQIDYAIKAYFGWLGGTITAASHYAVQPFSSSAYPDVDMTETASMGFLKSLPATQSRYVTEFYKNNQQISQAYADMRHYAQLGQADKVQEILDERGDEIALAKFYDKTAKDMAKMRQAISLIMNDEKMSGAEKREEIDRMKLLIDILAEQMEKTRKSLRK